VMRMQTDVLLSYNAISGVHLVTRTPGDVCYSL
jgi:hypothetical protein